MDIGAVIVAAGLSSRMGSFKPLLPIGGKTIIRRVIDALRAGGAEQIVVVTGHQAECLEAHLSDCKVTTLRNPDYATTQMFDSAKIGLSYLAGRCSRILFTPVDVPMFTSGTVKTLLAADGEILRPCCGNMSGHPLVFDVRAVEHILQDGGEGGLRGAVSRSNMKVTEVEVADPGILYDADTPEDYRYLKELL